MSVRRILPFLLPLSLGCPASSPSPRAATPAVPVPAAAASVTAASLPPSEAGAKAALDSSPRHGEYVEIPFSAGGAPIRTWIVYPERRDKAGVVVLIHEVYGLSDWMRGVADQIAKDGFIAVAPDLVSGLGPNGGGTESVASRDDVVKLVRGLSSEDANARLDSIRAWALALPASNGRAATIGFCWGGGRSFAYAAARPDVAGAVVYYGPSPDSSALAQIQPPVLGHYGGDDARVNATIPGAEAEMRRLGRSFEAHLYEGAGHGFLRQQEGRDGANLKATRESWPRTVAFLKKVLG